MLSLKEGLVVGPVQRKVLLALVCSKLCHSKVRSAFSKAVTTFFLMLLAGEDFSSWVQHGIIPLTAELIAYRRPAHPHAW